VTIASVSDSSVPRAASLKMTSEHVAQLNRILADTFAEQLRLQFVLLATIDGRVVAHKSRINVDPIKFAALGSTMMSMSAAAVRELGGKAPDECLVTHESGLVCLGRTGPLGRLVLCHSAGTDLSMGLVVSGWRRTAALIVAAVQ
jgi:predicted regulator of Ras-like GTPase activity (Roadblock/LC7/MglB family)